MKEAIKGVLGRYGALSTERCADEILEIINRNKPAHQPNLPIHTVKYWIERAEHSLNFPQRQP